MRDVRLQQRVAVGRALIEAVYQRAAAAGSQRVYWNTHETNHVAMRLYDNIWLVAPVFWLWLASQIASSSQPSLGIYLLVLVGIVASMIVIGKILGWLNRAHQTLTGRIPELYVSAIGTLMLSPSRR